VTWVRLDDNFPDHPKVDGLSDPAFRLYVTALCHAGRLLTDGFVGSSRVSRLLPRFKRSYVDELVEAGLWDVVEGGWQIHDFLDRNPSAAKVKAEREAAAERMRVARQKRSAERSPERSRGRSPSPTRPDPLQGGSGPGLTSRAVSPAPAADGGAGSAEELTPDPERNAKGVTVAKSILRSAS
jgi:hypothetical protein